MSAKTKGTKGTKETIESLGYTVTNFVILSNSGTNMCSHLKVVSRTGLLFYVKLDKKGCIDVPKKAKVLTIEDKFEVDSNPWMEGGVIYESDNIICEIVEGIDNSKYFCSKAKGNGSDFKIKFAYPMINYTELVKDPEKSYKVILNRSDMIRKEQLNTIIMLFKAIGDKALKINEKISTFAQRIVNQMQEIILKEQTLRDKESLDNVADENEKFYEVLNEASKINYINVLLNKFEAMR